MVRRFVLAVQFLTRLPTPQVRDFDEHDLSRSAPYFPLVGAVIGALVAAPLLLLQARPWLAAAIALIIWVWVTGALHLDGLADIADGFGAAHRSPERLVEVLHDPHVGVFGVAAIVLQLIVKLVLLAELARAASVNGHELLWALVLIPAWARWGTLVWSRTVPPLQSGMAERFGWQIPWAAIVGWLLLLGATSVWAGPVLLIALPFAAMISVYWRHRLGGITGDCLGASTEVTESLLLFALVAAAPIW